MAGERGITRRGFLTLSAGGIVGATAILSACSGGAPAAPAAATAPAQAAPATAAKPPDAAAAALRPFDEQALFAAAKREAALTVYGTQAQLLVDSVRAPWAAKYPGITVEAVEATSGQTQQRIIAEGRAHNVKGDLLVGGAATPYAVATTDDGYLADGFALPEAANILPTFRKWIDDTNGRVYPYGVTVWGFLINTNIIKPADMPTRIADLLDPKYDDLLVMQDPRVDSGGSTWTSMVLAQPALGEAYLRKLFAKPIKIVTAFTDLDRNVIQGERGIALADLPTVVIQQPTAPLRWVVPQEGAMPVDSLLSILKGGPHPNAAQLFANFFLTEEAQRLMSIATGQSPVRPVSGLDTTYLLGDKPILGRLSWNGWAQDGTRAKDFAKSVLGA